MIDHEHTYPRKSDCCGICGRYRWADHVEAVVAKAPPLTAAQKARLSTLLRMSDIDRTTMERKAGLKRLVEPHALVCYPSECACGAELNSREDWAGHVADAILAVAMKKGFGATPQ